MEENITGNPPELPVDAAIKERQSRWALLENKTLNRAKGDSVVECSAPEKDALGSTPAVTRGWESITKQ